MRSRLATRFWFEAITGLIGLVLFVVTLFSREWIEALSGWDPDGGSGSVEIALAFALLALSAISMLVARRDYRAAKLRAALSHTA